MNNNRRKEIMKAITLMQEALAILNVARHEEGDYYEDMPDSLQESAQGYAVEQSYGYLEDAYCGLEDVINAAFGSIGEFYA